MLWPKFTEKRAETVKTMGGLTKEGVGGLGEPRTTSQRHDPFTALPHKNKILVSVIQ